MGVAGEVGGRKSWGSGCHEGMSAADASIVEPRRYHAYVYVNA